MSNATESPDETRTALDLSAQMGYSLNASALDETSNYTHEVVLAPTQSAKLRRSVGNLPSGAIVEELCSVFFSEANWYFCTIDKIYFDQAHRAWTLWRDDAPATIQNAGTAENLCFPALLFQILALATQFVPPNSLLEKSLQRSNAPSFDDISRHFSDTGERILNTLGRHLQAITAVQADLMRCAWLKNCGRGSESWHSLGNAVRQAQDQRLHLEPRSSQVTDQSEELRQAWCHEHRRRLWVTLFTWESHMALQLGRPRMINAEDCTVNAPIDTDLPNRPSRTLFTTPGPDERPSLYTSAKVKLYCAHQIRKLMSLGAFRPGADYGAIESIHVSTMDYLRNLPPHMRLDNPDTTWDFACADIAKHRLQISILTHAFLLTLHRPHAALHARSLHLAIAAAMQVLDASQTLFEMTEPHQCKIHTFVFYTIDAGMLLSAMLANCSAGIEQSIRSHAIESLRKAAQRLAILKTSVFAAIAGERALSQCLERLHSTAGSTPEGQSRVHLGRGGPTPDDELSGRQHTFSTSNSGHDGSASRPAATASMTVTPSCSLPRSETTVIFEQWKNDGPDFFDEIMNDEAWTASWLEQMNTISQMNFDFDEDGFSWGEGTETAVTT